MPGSNPAVPSGTNPSPHLELPPVAETAVPSVALAEELRRAVRDGRLPAGSRLPPSRGLAEQLGVSRGVVVRAYEQLVAEGYLGARTGSGTVVSDVRVPPPAPVRPPRPYVPANPGVPALGWFPRTEWMRAAETAMRGLTDRELGYGDPRGHPRLRRALAAYLGRTRAVVAPEDRVVVTAGFAQGARLVAEALARHGVEEVGVEDPGSAGVVATLRAGGVRTVAVPVDEQGVSTDALLASDLRAVLLTPAHQFPTGAVLTPARRTALLAWAAGRDGVVVEDDYDAEYRYDRSPVGAVQGLAPDRVVYGGSVSKSLAPGLRLGWLVAPAGLVDTLVEVKHHADIAAPVLEQLTLAVFLESGGLDRHVRRTAVRYAGRRAHLLASTERHLPGWRATGVAAGLHAVVVPPRPVPGDVLHAMAAASGSVGVVPLAAFAHGGAPGSGLVVGYGDASRDQLDRALGAMAAVLHGTRRG
ncbi:PLP-dependent aminotransferase family protein [Cellulomonas cellasea]|uniref:GntR family transcriptional regulator/MocR family aminotransferase n=1 Tax=Cellulomonas cellasea TaxID=43670 RepID=A0A7W4YAX4_9CELL|nr:PLP-dependent aminotransferase family protein [Cellulomonas cellasea]MBB2923275.1 GntR family transcriptional regulator/MocR family aminotransferase [Cellulomonas cellasea]